MKNSLSEQWRALKCKHTDTVPTVIISRKGRKSVAFQCVTCGKCAREVRKSKSGCDAEKLPPFDNEFRESKRMERAALYAQMREEQRGDE